MLANAAVGASTPAAVAPAPSPRVVISERRVKGLIVLLLQDARMVFPVSVLFILGVTSCSASEYVPCERSPGVVV